MFFVGRPSMAGACTGVQSSCQVSRRKGQTVQLMKVANSKKVVCFLDYYESGQEWLIFIMCWSCNIYYVSLILSKYRRLTDWEHGAPPKIIVSDFIFFSKLGKIGQKRCYEVSFFLMGPFSARGPVSASGLSISCPVAEIGRTGFFLTVDPFSDWLKLIFEKVSGFA